MGQSPMAMRGPWDERTRFSSVVRRAQCTAGAEFRLLMAHAGLIRRDSVPSSRPTGSQTGRRQEMENGKWKIGNRK